MAALLPSHIGKQTLCDDGFKALAENRCSMMRLSEGTFNSLEGGVFAGTALEQILHCLFRSHPIVIMRTIRKASLPPRRSTSAYWIKVANGRVVGYKCRHELMDEGKC